MTDLLTLMNRSFKGFKSETRENKEIRATTEPIEIRETIIIEETRKNRETLEETREVFFGPTTSKYRLRWLTCNFDIAMNI